MLLYRLDEHNFAGREVNTLIQSSLVILRACELNIYIQENYKQRNACLYLHYD